MIINPSTIQFDANAIVDNRFSTIQKININGVDYDIGSVDINIKELEKRISELEGRKLKFVDLSCKNCGAKIQQKYSDSIVKCPYCKTVYIIGTKQVNSVQ